MANAFEMFPDILPKLGEVGDTLKGVMDKIPSGHPISQIMEGATGGISNITSASPEVLSKLNVPDALNKIGDSLKNAVLNSTAKSPQGISIMDTIKKAEGDLKRLSDKVTNGGQDPNAALSSNNIKDTVGALSTLLTNISGGMINPAEDMPTAADLENINFNNIVSTAQKLRETPGSAVTGFINKTMGEFSSTVREAGILSFGRALTNSEMLNDFARDKEEILKMKEVGVSIVYKGDPELLKVYGV